MAKKATYSKQAGKLSPVEQERNRLQAENEDMHRALDPLRVDFKAANQRIEELEAKVKAYEDVPKRKRLPDDRTGRVRELVLPWNGKQLKLWLTVGTYADGRLGEIFIRGEKLGSFESGLLDGFAIAVSLALQYGMPVEHLVSKMKGMQFEPFGFTGDAVAPNVKSILDYIVRYLESRFLKPAQVQDSGFSLVAV